MTKLRIVDGIPEVEGDTQEIADLLRELGGGSKLTQKKPLPSKLETPISESDIPNVKKLVEMIEAGGRPLSFTMAELQKKQYDRVLSSKDEREIYELYYRRCQKAMALLKEKNGGAWETETISIDGVHVKRYTLAGGQKTQPLDPGITTTQ